MNVTVSLERLLPTLALTALLLGLFAAPVAAQVPIQPYSSQRPSEDFMARQKYLFSFSLRRTQGVEVSLSGTTESIPFPIAVPPTANGSITRIYGDGRIDVDSSRNSGNTTVNWSYANADQVRLSEGLIDFHLYAADNDGLLATNEDEGNMVPDIEVGIILFHLGKNAAVSLNAGFNLGAIDTGAVTPSTAGLFTLTDSFLLHGFTPPPPPYTALGTETPLPIIGSLPVERTVIRTPGEADITTQWSLKGAYYNARLGPALHFRINRYFSLSASAGVNMTYANTKLETFDTFTPPAGPLQTTPNISNDGEGWMAGYYAEAALNFWFSDTSGVFVGAAIQSGDTFDVTAGQRTASINFNSTTQFMAGFNFRF